MILSTFSFIIFQGFRIVENFCDFISQNFAFCEFCDKINIPNFTIYVERWEEKHIVTGHEILSGGSFLSKFAFYM